MLNKFLSFLSWNRIRGKPGLNAHNGFVNRTDSTLAVDGSGVFSITPAVTTYVVYSGGKKITKNAAETISITNDLSLHYVYFSTSGVLTVSTSAWDITSDNILIAMVYKDGATYSLHDERHGYTRDRAWHEWAHDTIGARYESGFGGTFADTTFSIAQGVIHDEDIEFDSGGTKTACRLWYRNTGLTAMRFESNITTPWKSNAGAPQYDNAGTMANVSANRYFCSYFYGTNDPAYPIYLVSGQGQYTTLAAARNEVNPSILLTTAEWKILFKVVYQENGGTGDYIETIDFRNTPTDHNSLTNRDATGAHPATAISNTPAGNIAATTVQAAIDELDSEKISTYLPFVAVDGTLATGANADVVASKLVYNKTCSDSDGDDVIDLHDGTVIGQIVTIYLGTRSGSDNAVITPVTKLGYSTITLDAANELATLQWQGATVGWAILYTSGGVA